MTEQTITSAPDFCESYESEEYLDYLDDLRESGVTNMFGGRAYLLADFPELTEDQAKEILLYWMRTFSERHPRA